MIPACPPTTGQLTSCGSRPLSSEINLFARTISKVVTPKILFGLYLNKVSEGIISNRYRYYKKIILEENIVAFINDVHTFRLF